MGGGENRTSTGYFFIDILITFKEFVYLNLLYKFIIITSKTVRDLIITKENNSVTPEAKIHAVNCKNYAKKCTGETRN